MSSKVPEVVQSVLPRTASSLLPAFQELCASWPPDEERQHYVPGTPDVGVYLREYTEKSVATDNVSYESAAAELAAAKQLASPDFFSRYANIPVGHGLTGGSYEELRAMMVDPTSKESQKAAQMLGFKDYMEYRKGQVWKGLKIMTGLYVVLFAITLWNNLRNATAAKVTTRN